MHPARFRRDPAHRPFVALVPLFGADAPAMLTHSHHPAKALRRNAAKDGVDCELQQGLPRKRMQIPRLARRNMHTARLAVVALGEVSERRQVG